MTATTATAWTANPVHVVLTRVWLALGAFLATVGGIALAPAPTNVAGWDEILTASYVLAVLYASLRTPSIRLVPALLLCVALGSSVIAVSAALVVAAVVLTKLVDHITDAPDDVVMRSPLSGWAGRGLVGIIVGYGTLTLTPVGPFGLPSVLVAISLVPLVVGLVRQLGRPQRRALLVGLVLLVVVTGIGLVAGLRAASTLASSADQLDQMRSSSVADLANPTPATVETIEVLEADLGEAHDRLRHWSVAPAYLVPVLSQHLQVLDTLAATGATSARSGVEVVGIVQGADEVASNASGRDAFRSRVDRLVAVQAPVSEVGEALDDTLTVLEGRSVDWILPPGRDRLRASSAQIADVRSELTRAGAAADSLARLLGYAEPQQVLVLLTNPAEARRGGGIVGAYVELSIFDGDVSVERLGRAAELNWAGPASPLSASEFPASFLASDPHRYVQNWTETTDPAVTARAAATLYPELGGSEVDAVIIADPHGLAAIVGLSGPVSVVDASGEHVAVHADDVADLLLRGQYQSYSTDFERDGMLLSLAEQTFSNLIASSPPLDEIVAELRPALEERRISVHTTEGSGRMPETNLGLVRMDVDPAEAADWFGVVHTNATGNKLDAYVSRQVDYVVTTTSTGGLETSITVNLTLDAEAAQLPEAAAGRSERTGLASGSHHVHVSLFTPHHVVEVTARHAGQAAQALPVAIADDSTTPGVVVPVSLEPGETVSIVFSAVGAFDPRAEYDVLALAQPLAHPDELRVLANGVELFAGPHKRAVIVSSADQP